jgi:hypothetical protein
MSRNNCDDIHKVLEIRPLAKVLFATELTEKKEF